MRKMILASILLFVPVRCQKVKIEVQNYKMNIQEKAIVVVEAFAFTCMIAISSILMLLAMNTIFQLVKGIVMYINNKDLLQVQESLDKIGILIAYGFLVDIGLLCIVIACNWLMEERESKINWK